ncbi:MAG: hypothetical protein AAB956_02445, partial [Patescibacteria group bacterium]
IINCSPPITPLENPNEPSGSINRRRSPRKNLLAYEGPSLVPATNRKEFDSHFSLTSLQKKFKKFYRTNYASSIAYS